MVTRTELKVADEMWVGAALLQREGGPEADFTPAEIVERAEREGLSRERRPGVLLHAQYHAVASRKPNPGRYRMLTETRRGRRRLFRPGDASHPAREGAKTHPRKEDLPPDYRFLVDWYLGEYVAQGNDSGPDPMDELREWAQRTGLFRGVNPDEYVRELRKDWEA